MQKVVQTLTEEDVKFNKFFDFGCNAYGTLEIEFETGYEENIEIVIGEIAENGRIVHPRNYCTFIQNIIRSGIGRNVIKFKIPDFISAYGCNPHYPHPEGTDGEIAPFRYVEVNRHYGEVTVRRTAYYPDWDDAASDFQCDNEVLKKVWDFCKYSIKAESVFDVYIDGERERLPYEGDAVINQLGHFCCDASYLIARNTIDYFFQASTWPVEWLLLTVKLVYDYYMYSADKSSLQKWLAQLDNKLLLTCRNEDGLLTAELYKKTPDCKLGDIIDWPPSEQDNYEIGDINFVPNSYLCGALQMMYELTNDKKYLDFAVQTRNSLRKYFLKNGLFTDSITSNHTALHTAFFALYFGICEGEEIENHKNIILAKDMSCSVYCAQFLLETCFMYGLEEHAVKLITSDGERSWLNMMREGATTTMETWGNRIKSNQDWTHAWGAAPANVVTRYLCGIRPIKPGFSEFCVDPHPGTLNKFKVRQMTIHGAIELEWSPEVKVLTVPENTVAIYHGKKYVSGKHIL